MEKISTFLKYLIVTLIFVIIVNDISAQNVPERMYFKFNSTGNQQNYASSPVGNNPATLNGISVGSTGQFGTALIGNGATSTSNNLNTGWVTNMPSTGWTISFWLNNFPATASTTYYYFGDATGATFRCFTGGVAGNNALMVRGTGITDVPITSIGSSPVVIHIVYTGSAILVYKNATLSNTVSQSSVSLTGSGPFLVGGYSSSNSFSSGTLMDEFRMYNRALTATEITATYNQMLPVGGADAGIRAITAPPDTFCSATKTVSVILKNFGNIAISSVKINWKVNNVTQTVYNWNGNLAPNDSVTANIGSYNFAGGTSYNILAYTTLPNGGNDTITSNDSFTRTGITVNPAATAVITPNGTPALCLGDSILLTATSGTGYTYQWKYAGNDITGQTSQTMYAKQDGYYNVVVNNSYNCPKTSSGLLVTVDTLATPTIKASGSTTICKGDSVKISAPTGKTLTYQWKKDGIDITGAIKSIYYANATGSFKVVVTKNGVCVDSSSAINILVNPRPVAKVMAGGPTTFCQGDSVVFTADTATGLSYQWKRNGIKITGATSFTYIAKTDGSYRVVVSNSYPCYDSSSAITVKVNPLPVATATPTGSTTFCNGDSLRINANVVVGYTYQWRLNGVNIPKATKSYYYASVTGMYRVVVTSTLGCTDSSAAVSITVKQRPSAITIPSGSYSLCSADSLIINANAGTGLTYQWKKNGLDIPGATNSYLVVKTTGSYTVTVTNSGLCSEKSKAVIVTLYNSPEAHIAANGPTTFCYGSSVVLKGNSGYAYTYQWYRDGAPLSGKNDTLLTVNATGSYFFETTLGPCKARSPVIGVDVTTPVAYLGNDTTLCSGQSIVLDAGAGNTSYLWSTGATTQSITVDSSGIGTGTKTISVKVTLKGCDRYDTIKITFTACTGINGNIEAGKVLIFPNPSNGIFSLEFNKLSGEYEINIFDINGRIVNQHKVYLYGQKQNYLMDISTKPKGFYFLIISDGLQIKILKLLIE